LPNARPAGTPPCDSFPQPSRHSPEYRQRICQRCNTEYIIYKTDYFFK
jgi:hypothetical protein